MKIIAVILALSLAGCATPRGAGYVPLVDMQGKDQGQFARDVGECQQYAKQRMEAIQGAIVGGLVGAALMAALSPGAYRRDAAQAGMVVGGFSGALGANENQETIIKRCLAGRGYNVLN
jgi:uncharacterized protein YcfJ